VSAVDPTGVADHYLSLARSLTAAMSRQTYVAAAGVTLAGAVLTLAVLANPAPTPVTVSLVAAPTEAPRAGVTATGSGTWSIPDQLAPGIYRSGGSTNPNRQCIWNRFAGPDPAIVDTGLGDPGEAQTVTIAPDDRLSQAADCGAWTKVN
jgi:hypothetical protein